MSEDPREQILRWGGASMGPATNVAFGSYGYQVLKLEFDGLLQREIVKTGPLHYEYVTRYTLTEAGRVAAAMVTD